MSKRKKLIAVIVMVTLFFTANAFPAYAQDVAVTDLPSEPLNSDPIAYTHDFDDYANVVGTLNADGTKTAFIFSTPEDCTLYAEEVTGLERQGSQGLLFANSSVLESPIAIEDVTVFSEYPNTNFNSESLLCIGEHALRGYARTYVKFDISAFITANISYRNIMSAKLHFTSTESDPSPTAVIEAYFAKSDWTASTITWGNRPDYYNSELIGNMNCAAYISTTEPEDAQRDIYITKAVMAWLQGVDNYGIVLKEKEDFGCNEFFSTSSMQQKRPYVSIIYDEFPLQEDLGIISGESYYIINKRTGQFLTTTGFAENSYVFGDISCTENKNYQKWKVTKTDDAYIIQAGESYYELESTDRNIYGTRIWLNDSGQYNKWSICRNWNGTYKISPQYVPFWGCVITDDFEALYLESYTPDFEFSDEWTFCPVSSGTAALFANSLAVAGINTTIGLSDIYQYLQHLGYSPQYYLDVPASVGFNTLCNSDLFFYSGHGSASKLAFTHAYGQFSYIDVAGAEGYSLSDLDQNALSRQKFVYLSSCLTGADEGDNNFAGKLYQLGANGIFTHTHINRDDTGAGFDLSFMYNVLLGRTLGDSLFRSSQFFYNDNEYLGEVLMSSPQAEELPLGFSNEFHLLGDLCSRPVLTFEPLLDIEDYQYCATPQLSYSIDLSRFSPNKHEYVYNGQQTATPKFSIIGQPEYNKKYDVYVDGNGATYCYYTGTDQLVSYEPYIGEVELGEHTVDPYVAKCMAQSFMQSCGYSCPSAECSCVSSNAFSKTCTVTFQSNSGNNKRLSFCFQSDDNGNVYLVRFVSYDYYIAVAN